MMRLQLMHERLKESLRQYERELMQQQEKDRQLTNKNKLLSTKLKAEKDEVSQSSVLVSQRAIVWLDMIGRQILHHRIVGALSML